MGKPGVIAGALGAVLACAVATPALADFPYPSGTSGGYDSYKLPASTVPDDISGGGSDWKYAATPEAGSPHTANPKELNGVRGAHIVDATSNPVIRTGWMITTGRPDVTIAVLDSGIKWNDAGAMKDLAFKLRLNRGEAQGSREAA